MKDSGFVYFFFFLNLKALDEDYVTMAEVPPHARDGCAL